MNDQNLTDDQKKLVDQYTDQVLGSVLEKIAEHLSDEDIDEIVKLDQEDDESGKKVKNYLASKIPNIDTIIFEEIQAFRREQASEVDSV